jgi:hypothetical protein
MYLSFTVFFLGFASASDPAAAAPVTLLCDAPDPHMVEDGPTMITLDEAHATASVQFAGFSLAGSSSHIPPNSVGPMHATFTPQQVTFENPDPNSAPHGGHDEYTLNRLTGQLSGLWGEDSMTCKVAAQQF